MPKRLIELLGIWAGIALVSLWTGMAAFVGLGAALLISSGFWAMILPSAVANAVETIFWAGLWLCGAVSFGIAVLVGVQIWRSPWP